MEFLKELFGGEAMTYEQLEKAVSGKGIKLADLSKGEYVSKGKFDDLQSKNKSLDEQLKTLNGEMQKLKENNATAEDYKTKFEELQNKIAEDQKQAEAKKADDELTAKITALFPTDKEFTSDYVKNGLISEIKSKFAEDNTKGIESIYTELTQDKDGIFKSVNPTPQMTGMGSVKDSDIGGDAFLTGLMKGAGLKMEK